VRVGRTQRQASPARGRGAGLMRQQGWGAGAALLQLRGAGRQPIAGAPMKKRVRIELYQPSIQT
jgi:hypothetical protein